MDGVLYVGTAETYFDQAVQSLESLRRTNDLPASIVTTDELAAEKRVDGFDEVIPITDPYDDVRDKIYNLALSPYDSTLYLDGDSRVLGDISPLFDLLDRVELAAAHAIGRLRITIPGVPDAFPELSTAVLGYRDTESVRQLLDSWERLHREQVEHGRPDGEVPVEEGSSLDDISRFGRFHGQPPFREALYGSDVEFSILPPEYNYGHTGRGYAYHEVKILHGYRCDELAPIINEYPRNRVLVGDSIYFPQEAELVPISEL